MGTLSIVATPIGNLEDVTLRALRVLREADWLLAEDTRRTRILLDHFEIPGRPDSLHAHNEASRIDAVLAALDEDRAVALVSDAGTPLVSDPGGRLVAAVTEAGHRVEAVPGPSALLAAWTVSGLATDHLLFLGFLPRKSGARRKVLEGQKNRPESFVFFESPRRVAKTLAEIAEILGDRRVALARELTKKHEEVIREGAASLSRKLEADPPRGECTIVVEGAADDDASSALWEAAEVDQAIDERLTDGASVRDIASELVPLTRWTRRDLYARALARKQQTGDAA